jgi:glycosyltransferase involved in cell wall biosynthesis
MANLTVVIPTKNESRNLAFCLQPLTGWASSIVVVDSSSTDGTQQIATDHGAKIVTFSYQGGWPKKRQHTLETYPFETDWILLLDADEILTEEAKKEIEDAIQRTEHDGFYLWFNLEFLGRMLTRSDPGLRKLSLFRVGKGNFEKRFGDQDATMGDMEVHEHVLVQGKVGELKSRILHRNFNSLSRFIIKHDEYSNYECLVHTSGQETDLKERLFGRTEERRRYLKKRLIRNPLAPIAFFFYLYFVRLGFLEGKPGFYYILYQCIYLYFVQSKVYEIEQGKVHRSYVTGKVGH